MVSNAEKKTEFAKYLKSDNCEEYFELLQKKPADLIQILDSNIGVAQALFALVYSPTYGIKMIKLFSEFYSKYSNHDCLYTEEIRHELEKGLSAEDTVVQMRFV